MGECEHVFERRHWHQLECYCRYCGIQKPTEAEGHRTGHGADEGGDEITAALAERERIWQRVQQARRALTAAEEEYARATQRLSRLQTAREVKR